MVKKQLTNRKLQKIEEYLGVFIDDLRASLIEKAMHIDNDYSKKVLLEVYGEKDYKITIVKRGYRYYRKNIFSFEFSIITPFDVNGFESFQYDLENGLYIDVDSNEKLTENDLLDEAINSAISGYCNKFENEFEQFLNEFYKFI